MLTIEDMFDPPVDDTVQCSLCDAYLDHDPECDGNCWNCPVEGICPYCGATPEEKSASRLRHRFRGHD